MLSQGKTAEKAKNCIRFLYTRISENTIMGLKMIDFFLMFLVNKEEGDKGQISRMPANQAQPDSENEGESDDPNSWSQNKTKKKPF